LSISGVSIDSRGHHHQRVLRNKIPYTSRALLVVAWVRNEVESQSFGASKEERQPGEQTKKYRRSHNCFGMKMSVLWEELAPRNFVNS
jgi:hypothetical protein